MAKKVKAGIERELVAAFDEDGAPRAFGIADTLEDAIKEAVRQATDYISEKRALGEHLKLKLYRMRPFGNEDLHRTIGS